MVNSSIYIEVEFVNTTYGLMSGTSMAEPHVSGGALLLLEKINNDPDMIDLT